MCTICDLYKPNRAKEIAYCNSKNKSQKLNCNMRWLVFREFFCEESVRERRLHSILSFDGEAAELVEKSESKSLTCKNGEYEQCSSCGQGCCLSLTVGIEGAAVITHSPIGCGIGDINFDLSAKAAAEGRGIKRENINHIVTNIGEKDTVYGSSQKLKNAIREAERRYHPKVIFVQSSCVTGIIGEDIERIISDEEKQLGYPIVPIYCEGFKSRLWSSGFDACYHGILRKIVKPPKKKQKDLVNVFNFLGADTVRPIFDKLNLRTNYLVPLANLEELETMSEAACSTQICETLSTYITAVLEEEYDVPKVNAPSPFGIDWTDQWIREVAKHTNREELAEEFIKSEHERIAPELEELRKKLRGRKLFVMAGDAFAHQLANIAKDLDMQIIGLSTLHHDQVTDGESQVNTLKLLVDGVGNISNLKVCNRQPYQMIKIVKEINPDLMIVRHSATSTIGTKLGIPTLSEGDANYSIAYDGVITMGRRFYEALQTKKRVKHIAEHTELPYTDWWLNEVEDPFYFKGGTKNG